MVTVMMFIIMAVLTSEGVTQLVRLLGGGNLDEHGTKLLGTFVVIFLEK